MTKRFIVEYNNSTGWGHIVRTEFDTLEEALAGARSFAPDGFFISPKVERIPWDRITYVDPDGRKFRMAYWGDGVFSINLSETIEPVLEETVKDTRKDWEVETWADGHGIWHCKVASAAGWGNTGPRDIGRHIDAIRARARRAIRREIQDRQAAPVGPVKLVVAANDVAANNVLYSLTFKEI